MTYQPKSALGRIVNDIEETLIALLLGLMTIITFANVVARYIFNANLLWALETTVFLFAWLVLLGAAYVVKTRSQLGVDAVIRAVPPALRKALALLAVACCIAFTALLLKGAWDYWAPFVGRQAFYEVNDIRMPDWLRFIEPILNEGEPYEKLPRFVPYAVLPFSMALLLFRFLQQGWFILTGKADTLIASHEAEEMVADAETKGR